MGCTYLHALLALGMLVAGSINTIAYKVADWQVAPGRYNATQCFKASTEPKHNDCRFTHPFVQVYAMFLGEALCLGAFFALRAAKKVQYKPFNWLVFWPCAVCDMCGTSLMLLGLLLTFMSNFQMLRGSVVLFTGIFSRIFLGRRLSWANWGGMLLVLFGTAIVGLDALIHPQHTATASNPFLGNILIILAQIIVAVQFVLEEKLVTGLCVHPLMAVGLEGLFGLGTLSVVLAGMYQLDGVKGLSETPLRLEDPLDALAQLSGGNWVLSLSMLAAVLSIAFYNFFGISVTKELSAAHRMVMDCTRTVIVWLFSLSVHYASPSSGRGQPFSYVQLAGFAVLVLGSMVYYGLLTTCARAARGPRALARTIALPSRAGDDPLLVNDSTRGLEDGQR